MEGSDPGLILLLSRDLPLGTEETHDEPPSRVIDPQNILNRRLENCHCSNLRCRCKQPCYVTIMALHSLLTFLNTATHFTYYYLGSNPDTFLCCGSDRHLMFTFYGSINFTTGDIKVINLHLKVIVFMSFIFLRHAWRRCILKYVRDKGLQRYGWQIAASIPVLLWPSFNRAKRITFKRISKFIKLLWAIQRH